MDMMIGREEWRDLLQLVEDVERALTATTASEPRWDRCADALKTLNSTAAMLGMEGLATAGGALEAHLERRVRGSGGDSVEATAVFQFAVNALVDQVRRASSTKAGDIEPEEVVSIVEEGKAPSKGQKEFSATLAANQEAEADEAAIIDQLVGAPPEERSQTSQELDQGLDVIEDFCRRIQGTLSVESGEDGKAVARIEIVLSPEVFTRLKRLLNPTDKLDDLRLKLPEHDETTERALKAIKDFMQAISDGDLQGAEKILATLSDNRHSGLYKEIGGIARELHNSLRDFVRTMDPALREMVEEKIPDSGNRLEHIIKLTESAANTTLDHVESLQKRNEKDQERLATIREIITGLYPLGENAQEKLDETVNLVQELLESTQKSHEDLIRILTAQDYQDLTGQIIMKIMALLEDLEAKLVQLIAKFGVKVEKTKKAKEELYGPVHEAVQEALHSQSDVDALLAEFGF